MTLRSSDVDQEDSHDPVIENVYNGELRKAFKPADGLDAQQLSIPFIANQPLIKGLIVGYGAEPTAIDAKTREVLLLAIARSTAWIQQVVSAQRSSFEEIGAGEHLAERYVRRLVQLAFISPKIIAAIDAGTAPSGLTIARLTQSMPYAWMKQEQLLGIV